MIKIYSGPEEVKYEQFIFPGGEISVRLPFISSSMVTIDAKIQSAREIVELLMLTDALRNRGVSTINLVMPYVPYARQDRVSVAGEALSIRVFANIINSQNYTSVTIWDPHSDVTPALINNLIVISQEEIAMNTPCINWAKTILVAPDAGAAKKIYKLAALVGSDVIVASKIRDPKTGNITGTAVDVNPCKFIDSATRFLIVDDICDGGRTFIELAKVIHEWGDQPIDLYVTHGIFSKGMRVFDGLIDNIYCANPWFEDKRIILV